MVVDDEPMVISLVTTVLDREGFRTVGTSDPMGALEVAADPTVKPDLLLTDVTMPLLNGPVLARLIQRDLPGTRILFMTAHSPSLDEEHGIPYGADILRKPFRVGELLERVRRALGMQSSAAC
jgi:DNA-binding response OmpR family regulator